MHTCPKCLKQSPDDAAFCGFCGAALPRPSDDAAKRTVFGYVAGGDQAEELPPGEQPTQPIAPPSPAEPVAAAPHSARPAAAAVASPVAGRYALGQPAGELPVGTLWRAVDAEGGETVDLLLVDGAVFPSPLDQERARREMRQLQKVDCPSMLRIRDHGKHDGQLFVVTDAVRGRTLTEVLAAGPLGLEDAQRFIRDIGAALSEAQKVGVIHRDVAPHNVLVTDAGEIKVRGFGLAAPVKRHVFGTAEYLSPEQATGRPVDQRSNIYSLGALMYHLLVGAPPFTGAADAVLEQHQKSEPPMLPAGLALPARVEQLIRKALDKSSSRRHLTLRQFLREVDALVASTTAQEAAPPAQPLSFETPLHGVTALTGGDRPPSSELPLVRRRSGAEAAGFDSAASSLTPGTGRAPQPHAAPPAGPGFDIPMAKTLLQEDVEQAGAGAEEGRPKPTTRPPVTPDTGAFVGGELASGQRISLRQSSEYQTVEPQAPRAAKAPPPGAAPAGQHGKPGFRETMWFFKGEMESALAEDGTAEPPPPETETVEDLADKYKDDGSLSEEAAARLSLRTGKTQMMQAMNIPKGKLPGKAMQAEEFLTEMHRGQRTAIWVGIGVVVVVVVVVGIWLAVKFTGG